MISADVKTKKKTRNKRSSGCISYKQQMFIRKEVPPKLEILCKKDMYLFFF